MRREPGRGSPMLAGPHGLKSATVAASRWRAGSRLGQQEHQPHGPPACAATMDPFLDAQPGAPSPVPPTAPQPTGCVTALSTLPSNCALHRVSEKQPLGRLPELSRSVQKGSHGASVAGPGKPRLPCSGCLNHPAVAWSLCLPRPSGWR